MAMTMRERIARAISGSGVTSAASLRKADAVLTELQTPTDGMARAAVEAYRVSRSDVVDDIMGECITAAICAAREGK